MSLRTPQQQAVRRIENKLNANGPDNRVLIPLGIWTISRAPQSQDAWKTEETMVKSGTALEQKDGKHSQGKWGLYTSWGKKPNGRPMGSAWRYLRRARPDSLTGIARAPVQNRTARGMLRTRERQP